MKSLKQKFAESEAKLENLSNTKLAVDNRSTSISVLFNSKDNDYIPPFKRNHKENAYFARLDKDKSSNIDVEISKLESKSTIREHKKSVFVPACHLCDFVEAKPKFETRSAIRNINVHKFVHVCHFCGVPDHICLNFHKLNFKHFVFQSRICDDISSAISPNRFFICF